MTFDMCRKSVIKKWLPLIQLALPARCPFWRFFREIINTLPRRCLLVSGTLPYHRSRCREIIWLLISAFQLSSSNGRYQQKP
ncbi:hypothetical protein KCP74_00440 [Salmonella enterica subsp. enterica]|nr:hypothetical protein KCP74_00440 [Salmonella enterica subsp. enterica]